MGIISNGLQGSRAKLSRHVLEFSSHFFSLVLVWGFIHYRTLMFLFLTMCTFNCVEPIPLEIVPPNSPMPLEVMLPSPRGHYCSSFAPDFKVTGNW